MQSLDQRHVNERTKLPSPGRACIPASVAGARVARRPSTKASECEIAPRRDFWWWAVLLALVGPSMGSKGKAQRKQGRPEPARPGDEDLSSTDPYSDEESEDKFKLLEDLVVALGNPGADQEQILRDMQQHK